MTTEAEAPRTKNFIREIIDRDLEAGTYDGRVVTRFPPEPNGYLHIGHAKSICLNFGIARDYPGGVCHLRFDDTNPTREEAEYIESILADVRWLGFEWGDKLFYASDYFGDLHEHAVTLIKKGKAYVCSLSSEEFKAYRGVPTRPGEGSPGRDRSVEENLDLFARMRAGEFEEGAYVVRARIDMASPNLHMRDPVIYRILKVPHLRTGDTWCVYPTYDFTHCLSDSIERITHSVCTLEFEVHRPLYDWVLDELNVYHCQQIEFARLNLTYTVMSKRRLLELVEEKHVDGWDDPRMPTLSGLRRRGVPPEAIRTFCDKLGVTKYESLTDIALLEHAVRDELNRTAPRVMGVLRPLKVIIDNYPGDEEEWFEAVNNPEDPTAGTRKVPFTRELYVERDDFMEDPPKKFHRLAPGREVRLRYACLATCTHVVKDEATGEVTEVHCRWDPDSRGGSAPDGHKVRGTIHWVSASHALDAEVRLYDRLFTVEDPISPEEGKTFKDYLNPASLEKVVAKVEPSLAEAKAGARFQFERLGYFCVDSKDSTEGRPVFNRTVPLRDSWSRKQGM